MIAITMIKINEIKIDSRYIKAERSKILEFNSSFYLIQ